MAINQLKAALVLKKDDDYISWKNYTEVWQMLTDIEAKKRGPAVYLSLTTKAKKAVRVMKPLALGGDKGVEIILLKLDLLFLKDRNTRDYVAFKKFRSIRELLVKTLLISYFQELNSCILK